MKHKTMVKIIEKGMESIFEEVSKIYDMKSGDVSPEQEEKIDNIKDELYFLLTSFVNQNKYSTNNRPLGRKEGIE